MCCALAAACASLAAQQQPTFRARTDLVQLDVVVVDAEGRPVRGLTKDDFLISDRTRPQAVAVFEEIAHERPPAPILPPTLRQDVADNTTAATDRIVMLVLDDLHFQGKTDDVKIMALRVVEQIGTPASVGLVTTSGVFGVEPTSDRALLFRELDRFLDKFDPEGKRVDPAVRSGLIMPDMGPGVAGPRAEPKDLARFFGDMTQYRTLEDVARMMGADDSRRKAFVWISGGNPGPVRYSSVGVEGSPTSDFYLNALGGLLEELRRSNVATYAVYTGDFGGALLREVADLTGGFVIDPEDFEAGLARLASDLDHYYLLGFYPDNPQGRGFRQVDVRVNRPGLTVRHRRGYQPGGAPAPPKNETPLARLSGGIRPNPGLPLRFQAAAMPSAARGDARVLLAIDVESDRPAITEPDGLMRDVLQYAVWAVDLQKKKVVRNVTREARVILDARNDVRGPSDTVTYQVQASLVLPPGRYQLRASATSRKLAKGGSVYLEVDVPDFKKAGIALGGVVLAVAPDFSVPLAANQMTRGWLPITPALSREFARDDTLRVICDVVRQDRIAADIVVELLDLTGRVLRTIEKRRVGTERSTRIDASLSLRDVTPGGYTLRVAAREGASVAQREVGFVVKN